MTGNTWSLARVPRVIQSLKIRFSDLLHHDRWRHIPTRNDTTYNKRLGFPGTLLCGPFSSISQEISDACLGMHGSNGSTHNIWMGALYKNVELYQSKVSPNTLPHSSEGIFLLHYIILVPTSPAPPPPGITWLYPYFHFDKQAHYHVSNNSGLLLM